MHFTVLSRYLFNGMSQVDWSEDFSLGDTWPNGADRINKLVCGGKELSIPL